MGTFSFLFLFFLTFQVPYHTCAPPPDGRRLYNLTRRVSKWGAYGPLSGRIKAPLQAEFCGKVGETIYIFFKINYNGARVWSCSSNSFYCITRGSFHFLTRAWTYSRLGWWMLNGLDTRHLSRELNRPNARHMQLGVHCVAPQKKRGRIRTRSKGGGGRLLYSGHGIFIASRCHVGSSSPGWGWTQWP